MGKNVKQEMMLMKETKGTVVYETKDEKAAVSVVYVKKTAFPDGKYPQKINLTIESEG